MVSYAEELRRNKGKGKREERLMGGGKLLARQHCGTACDPLTVCKWDLTVRGEYSCLGMCVCVCVDLTHL